MAKVFLFCYGTLQPGFGNFREGLLAGEHFPGQVHGRIYWMYPGSETTRLLDSLVRRGAAIRKEHSSGHRSWAPSFTAAPEILAVWAERQARRQAASAKAQEEEQKAQRQARVQEWAEYRALHALRSRHAAEYEALRAEQVAYLETKGDDIFRMRRDEI